MSGIRRHLSWMPFQPRTALPSQPRGSQRGRGSRTPAQAREARRAVREREILAQAAESGSIVEYGGRLAVVRDDLLPAELAEMNLREVAEVLEAASMPYGLVPDGELVHRVALAPGTRADALAACAKGFAGRPVYADLLGHRAALGTVLAEELPEAVAAAEAETPGAVVAGIRLYIPVVTSGYTLHMAADQGCDLEFWKPANGPGGVASLRETPFGWWVPSMEATAHRRIGDRDYPVVTALDRRFPEDIDFPIDAVITWVDGSDPQWRRRRDRAAAATAGVANGEADSPVGADTAAGPDTDTDTDTDTEADAADSGDHRFRDRGELRSCLRSIAAYAPWIRRVFLVTDDQVPDWLALEHPGLTVVHHRELFADPGALPVFNSHAIETQLHRIPDLAEHYLYFNDDIFLGRPQRPQNYFLPSGLPKVFHDTRAVPPSSPDSHDDVYTTSQRATRRTVEALAGRTYPRILAHAPYAQSRSLYARLEEALPGGLDATSRSVFRSATDLAPVTLALHLALAQGRAVEGDLATAYVSTAGTKELQRLGGLLRDRGTDAFCLADDSGTEVSPDVQQRELKAFLEAYFPVASPYEAPGRAAAKGRTAGHGHDPSAHGHDGSADRMIGAAPVAP
ncbi:stealth family protein [Streptomyces sp. ZAF1911]|uniref:stealth family protein n=1 Tax=Streptomyces sp. ZAF1911 TaxID=2944129 RepID=UPI00237A7DBD|nr:stealth family protein [Streptomyces sp. ZAF1911]MDD9380235.1 stealth family protein [Streptomyces sp. ZAF1911]